MNDSKRYFYIMPAVAFVTIFSLIPVVITIGISFTDFSGIGAMNFVGFQNYIDAFQDPNFKLAVINTIVWVIAGLIIPIVIPFLFAVMIYNSDYSSAFKKIFYMPNAISGVAIGLIMSTLLSTSGLPVVFDLLGMDKLATNWLNIPYYNTLVMIISGIWAGIGMNMILFLVALANLDSGPVEAAIIDGAQGFKKYYHVIIPMLKPTFIVVILMSVVNSMKTFDGIWVMTGGGPYRTSETIAVMMYKESFINQNMGEGAAIAIILSIICVIISYVYLNKTMGEN